MATKLPHHVILTYTYNTRLWTPQTLHSTLLFIQSDCVEPFSSDSMHSPLIQSNRVEPRPKLDLIHHLHLISIITERLYRPSHHGLI